MKLIDLLVKELPQLGGWPEGMNYCGQSAFDNELYFYRHPYTGQPCDKRGIFTDIHRSEYAYTPISRDQYESALAASKAVVGHNGWIQWDGGECPVDSDAIVEIKNRRSIPFHFNNDMAGDFDWAHTGSDSDIIAYRVLDQRINHRASDEQLEQDLNECIGQDFEPEWEGEGLPPAGCKCEVMESNPRSAFNKWTPCTVIHFNLREGRETQACIIDNNGDFAILYGNDGVKFRPPRTEAEKAREAAETAMRTCLAGTGAGITPMAAKGIYDAIAAGKIPGVKLEGK